MSDSEFVVTPKSVLAALTRLEPELPELFGQAWNEVSDLLGNTLRSLRNPRSAEDQRRIADSLIDVISKYPVPRIRLNAELALQKLIKSDVEEGIKRRIGHLPGDSPTASLVAGVVTDALRWSVEPEEVPSLAEEAYRFMSLPPGGVHRKTKSVKFRNLSIDFGELSIIAGGISLSGHEAVKEPTGLMIAAGLLLAIGAICKAATVELDELEASVFWGFIQVRDKSNNIASEKLIIEATHREREKYRRTPVEDIDIMRALSNLEAIKSIARVEGQPSMWKIIERFRIKA